MARIRNDAKGARTIRLVDGSRRLVDAGETVDVAQHRIARMAGGLVMVDDVPPIPAKLAAKAKGTTDADDDGRMGGSISAAEAAKAEVKALRVEYQEALGKKPFPGWDAYTLREKIAAAK